MQDWLGMSAGNLGRAIAAGKIDPVALTQAYLAAIDAHLLRDRIYARVTGARAMAGAVCLGKTHMSELAFSGLGLNPVTQTPPCVNDADAVPGGSSSGAATSV